VLSFDVKRRMDESDIDAVGELVAAAARADGSRPLSDHLWLDLRQGGRSGFAAVLGNETGHDHLVAYCQVSRGNDSWALELVVHPHHRYDITDIGPAMLSRAVAVVAAEGGGHLHWWVFEPTARHGEIAATVGLSPGRRLLQMRRPLPLEPELLAMAEDLAVRPFRVGRDEPAWLSVNNAAFASHPEQGGWDHEVLAARMDQDWFDPEGFLLHHEGDALAGFCWTKMHLDSPEGLGEIYVIAVDPAHAGRRLGARLVVAGLDHMTRSGATTAMLFVDEDNAPAMAMYRSLGFLPHHREHAFVGDIPGDTR
jgi:mycothiol synthase